MADFQKVLTELAEQTGFGDLMRQKVHEADPERLRIFMQDVVGRAMDAFLKSIDEVEDWDAIEAEGKKYWEHIHPNLPLEERQRVERDVQIICSFFLCLIHNAISVMAYGESLNSLVQRAVAGEWNAKSDLAMCRSVRVDNNLRQHPRFRERYLLATRRGETDFLRAYNDTTPPLAGRIRYRALYFLLALLDCYGFSDRLSDRQMLDLCDHAKLDRWGNRIEDESYLGKRRREYQRHKFVKMSTHSM